MEQQQSQVFFAFLAFCGAMGAALGLAAWMRAPTEEIAIQQLPDHVTRLAFGVDAQALDPEAIDTGDWQPPPTRVHVQDLEYLGLGDMAVATYMVERYAHRLSACYDSADQGAVDWLQVDLAQGEASVVHPDPERARCVESLVSAWPWPHSLSGSLRVGLRAGAAI